MLTCDGRNVSCLVNQRMNELEGKSILLGVTGGIAAYKAATVASLLVQAGASVDVVMTEVRAALHSTALILGDYPRSGAHGPIRGLA